VSLAAWTPEQVAAAAGARLAGPPPAGAGGPSRAAIDSRAVAPGDLFFGLRGGQVDGGRFAPAALAAGAWGVVVAPEHAEAARCAAPGVLLAAEDPTAALGRLARAHRRALGCAVIGVTGSTGKTSTKEILAAVLAPHRRTVAGRANFNTEIGVPLEILETGAGTEVLVLELAMRGVGQIGELAEICEPDVGVIVNVGPVHLELLGSLEAIAAAKSELTDALAPGATAVVPADEPLLAPHRRADLTTVTFGPGGDVTLARDAGDRVEVDAGGERIALEVAFHQSHQKRNLLAAVAAARAVGVSPAGRVDVRFSAGRGERIELARDVVVINDCYNANPMSMRAALDELAAQPVAGRRIAVLGDMLELGPEEARFHQEIGRHAADRDVDVLVAVGPLAAAMVAPFGGSASAVPDADAAAALVDGLVRPGDTVLVKASRGVGLEVVAEALQGSVV